MASRKSVVMLMLASKSVAKELSGQPTQLQGYRWLPRVPRLKMETPAPGESLRHHGALASPSRCAQRRASTRGQGRKSSPAAQLLQSTFTFQALTAKAKTERHGVFREENPILVQESNGMHNSNRILERETTSSWHRAPGILEPAQAWWRHIFPRVRNAVGYKEQAFEHLQ